MLAAMAAGLAAQDVPAPAQFEVAAIKLSSGHPSGMFPTPGRLTVGNRTLKQTITEVYRLMGYQVMGASGWMDSIAYEIDAKAAGPAKFNEMVEMLKPLMASRFQLAFHWETKEMPDLLAGGGEERSEDTQAGSLGHNPRVFTEQYRITLKGTRWASGS